MSEPQNAILEMVASGKINAQEAATLLAALKSNDPPAASPEPLEGEIETAPPPRKRPKLPRKIRITILQKDGRTMNATIPLGLLNLGTMIGGAFAPVLSAENLATLTASTDQIIIKIEQ